ncbi:MAG TPA: TonB-dependent receptor [Steroidobacteraceae bacterium]|nr:TonB-dependent receptor [Steroidobacteraceae bacterium]
MRLIVALLLCCLGGVALGAQAPDRPVVFDIRPQPLSSALLQFSSQSGLQVVAAEAGVATRRVPGLRGRMLPGTALRRLLAGTGLTFRRIDADTIAVVRIGEAQPPPGRRASPETPSGTAGAPPELAEVPPLEEMEEVVVTGTRLQVPPNYSAPNPVVTVTGDEMRRLGMVNVSEAINRLVPQNIPSYQPALTGDEQEGTISRTSFFIGNTIANLRGLDPTFGSRTLTMIDGRRVVSTSNQADVVDLNIIPSNLLLRMDVATGGASATYGSGAMAGVVNLVLDKRMTGVSVDMDYGVTEAGDGRSPHVAIAGGTPLFGGRGHALLGVEWQDQAAIRDCAAARAWCAQSRNLYNNFSGPADEVDALLEPLPGFESYPARFRMDHVRYSQFAPTATIYSSSAANTSGYRFTADGTGIEEFAYGLRGGTGRNTVGGDGPLISSGLAMLPETERRTVFTNFEYDLTPRLTGYVQGSYARTDALNRNRYTTGTACVRFNSPGVAAQPGGSAHAGDFIPYGGNGEAFQDPFIDGVPYVDQAPVRSALWSNANFRLVLGNAPTGRAPPYYVPAGQFGSSFDASTPPTWNFVNGINPVWQRIRSVNGTHYWNLVGVTLTVDFEDPGVPATLPGPGRNAYAFLGNLTPEALYEVQRAFGRSSTAGGGSGINTLFGELPCRGFTAVRKVWNPQIQQWTEQRSETVRAVAGLRGRFGGDWQWEAYYQYGRTASTSRQNNVQTNLSFAFAMDAVIDDREFVNGVPNPTWNRPVCRITRDGIPVLDALGRPTSDPKGLAELAAGCRPLNVFGTEFADAAAAQLQREALAYAFKNNVSDGQNSLQTLSVGTTGTLWQGWAGPLTGAFGLEFREDEVDNQGSRGPFYLRADIARAWGDAFGGRTRVTEGYTELNLPLVSGLEGVKLWSVNAGARFASYNNKGGAGTTGQSATQHTLNWKFSTVFEPFDFLRLRMTRSRDLRAAGYRDLFLNQPGIPDSVGGSQARNPWRDRTADSQENQYERWGTVSVGNADLKPEKSDTLTFGIVLSPRGRAAGMQFAADYYDIRVKDGIYTPYGYDNPVLACWEKSGNREARHVDGQVDPAEPGINGLFNADLPECREIDFATREDGGRDLQDIVSLNASRPANGLPYRRQGIDMSWNYQLPLSMAFERLPGSLSLTVRATRALESSGIRQICDLNAQLRCEDRFAEVDLAGQIRSNVFIPGLPAVPKWTGNIITGYQLGDLYAGLSARYIGGAKLDNTWGDGPEDANYQDAEGRLLYGSVDRNRVDPYFNFALNGSYDLDVGGMKQFQVFGTINNLFNRSPPFTGGGLSGASAQYHDTLGRSYRFGIRMKF